MKVCADCKQRKTNASFYRDRRRPDGLTPYCKVCNNRRQAEFDEKNPDSKRQKQRKYQLKRFYGITLEKYEELFSKQKGCCPICLRHQSVLRKRLAVEHNHKTQEIRGLVCDYCNRFVIGRESDPELFRRAADFVAQGTGWFVPPKKKRKKRGKNPSNRSR